MKNLHLVGARALRSNFAPSIGCCPMKKAKYAEEFCLMSISNKSYPVGSLLIESNVSDPKFAGSPEAPAHESPGNVPDPLVP